MIPPQLRIPISREYTENQIKLLESEVQLRQAKIDGLKAFDLAARQWLTLVDCSVRMSIYTYADDLGPASTNRPARDYGTAEVAVSALPESDPIVLARSIFRSKPSESCISMTMALQAWLSAELDLLNIDLARTKAQLEIQKALLKDAEGNIVKPM